MAETQGQTRADFPFFMDIPTRWMDNDAYGHVNNVVYYSWFDTAVNHYLVQRGVLDIERGDVIGLPGVRLDYDRLAWSERSPDTSLINELQEVYAAAGVRIVHSADRYSALYGVYAPLEVLDPAASRAALHRLRGRHDERG